MDYDTKKIFAFRTEAKKASRRHRHSGYTPEIAVVQKGMKPARLPTEAALLATFAIFLEFSERIFSRLRRTLTVVFAFAIFAIFRAPPTATGAGENGARSASPSNAPEVEPLNG
jgi:hypothetical protein